MPIAKGLRLAYKRFCQTRALMLNQTDCWINSQSVLCDDRPDLSEGLASVYVKFKQLKVPAEQSSSVAGSNSFR